MGDPTVVFCPDCGTVIEGAVTEQDHGTMVARLEEDISNLERDLRGSRRLAERLKLAREAMSGDHSKQDGELYTLWVEATGRNPKTAKFGEGRQKAIRRMRKAGYDQDAMMLAIRCGAKFPYLVYGRWSATGSASDLKNDLIDMFKDEKRFDSLLALASKLDDDGAAGVAVV